MYERERVTFRAAIGSSLKKIASPPKPACKIGPIVRAQTYVAEPSSKPTTSQMERKLNGRLSRSDHWMRCFAESPEPRAPLDWPASQESWRVCRARFHIVRVRDGLQSGDFRLMATSSAEDLSYLSWRRNLSPVMTGEY